MSGAEIFPGHRISRGWARGAIDVRVLMSEPIWRQPVITLFGQPRLSPRMTAWFGEAPYTYSGDRSEPAPMPGWLEDLRALLAVATGARFNSVLLNLYRDGSDSVAWHSDDEPELGPEPTIASLSFGDSRRFAVRSKITSQRCDTILEDGDLLVMSGRSQADYRHCLPKTAMTKGPRVNATFRWVRPV